MRAEPEVSSTSTLKPASKHMSAMLSPALPYVSLSTPSAPLHHPRVPITMGQQQSTPRSAAGEAASVAEQGACKAIVAHAQAPPRATAVIDGHCDPAAAKSASGLSVPALASLPGDVLLRHVLPLLGPHARTQLRAACKQLRSLGHELMGPHLHVTLTQEVCMREPEGALLGFLISMHALGRA